MFGVSHQLWIIEVIAGVCVANELCLLSLVVVPQYRLVMVMDSCSVVC